MVNKNKGKRILRLVVIISVFIIGSIVGSLFTNSFYSKPYGENLDGLDEISIVSSNEQNQNEQYILGDNYEDDHISMNEFTDVRFIKNKEYFLNNPKHHRNTDELNAGGVCTTVAMQMLMGYHNYYSDRRIIPKEFLLSDYGDLNYFPHEENQKRVSGQGDGKIGTSDAFFMELFDLTTWPELIGIGQNIPAVTDAANRFVKKYAAEEIKDKITIVDEFFSSNVAKQDINNNMPIILGYQPVFTGAKDFHVVPAYGYAKYEGVDGFLVHYGWGSSRTLVWVPESWFGFQIRMSVKHTHTMEDGGENYGINNNNLPSYRKIHCKMCGADHLDKLYQIKENEIARVNYPIFGKLNLPEKMYGIDILGIGNDAFANQNNLQSINLADTIISIGNNAFENCGELSTINSLSQIAYIGDSAFKNCTKLKDLLNLINLEFIGCEAFYNCINLTNILLPNTLSYIGEKAFGSCNNLNLNIDSDNQFYCVQDNILYDKAKISLLGTGKINSNVHIIDSVTYIAPYAFESNCNLEALHINNSIIIGNYSFANCNNLKAVYFYSTYMPQLGENAFINNNFTLYVPYISQNDYRNMFIDYTNKINSLNMQVEFIDNEEVFDIQEATYGEVINNFNIPTKEGYTFEGWYDSNGVKYIDKNGYGVKLVDKEENFILYSSWAIKSYLIKINGNGYITWLGPNGLSDEECEIKFGTIISSINLISEFKATKQGYKEGEIFDHFEYLNKEINWTSVPDLGEDGVIIEIKPIWKLEVHTIYFATLSNEIVKEINQDYGTSITIPKNLKKTGFHFAGWYTNPEYSGDMVEWVTMPDLTPKTSNNSYASAQNNGSIQLYAKWTEIFYLVKYDANGGTGFMESSSHYYTIEKELSNNQFTRTGHYFIGWSREKNNVVEFNNKAKVKGLTEQMSITLYACWGRDSLTTSWQYIEGEPTSPKAILKEKKDMKIFYNDSSMVGANDVEGYTFKEWVVLCRTAQGNTSTRQYSTSGTIVVSYNYVYNLKQSYSSVDFYAIYTKNCVAEGTMITLADGSQKAVEELTGNEMLLVWNMMTGKFDVAPILFIDKDARTTYEVINLYFSDGTNVKVISEHAFWDFDLNEYVFLRNDAAKYIGHWFNKQIMDSNGNMTWTKVQLTNVEVKEEITTAYSPVTYSYLCYYVNGMLSMPGATEGLINIFEVDRETMKINEEAMKADIEKYGLYTYEEFAEIMPIPEEVFNAFNGQYLKVSIGKGLISVEELMELFKKYADFFL